MQDTLVNQLVNKYLLIIYWVLSRTPGPAGGKQKRKQSGHCLQLAATSFKKKKNQYSEKKKGMDGWLDEYSLSSYYKPGKGFIGC